MMLYFALKVPAWSCLGDLYDNALCVAVEPASWPAHYRWAVCAFTARPGAEWTHADGLGTPGTMTRTSQVFMNGGMCLALVDPENRNLVKLEGSLGGVCVLKSLPALLSQQIKHLPESCLRSSDVRWHLVITAGFCSLEEWNREKMQCNWHVHDLLIFFPLPCAVYYNSTHSFLKPDFYPAFYISV